MMMGKKAKVDHPPPYVQQMTSFALVTQNKLFHPIFTWKINNISELTRQKKFQINTTSLKSTELGYPKVTGKAGLHMKADENIGVWLILENIKQAIKPRIFYLIRDRSGAREPRHVCVSMRHFWSLNCSEMHAVRNKNDPHKSRLTQPAYVIDDSIVIDFYVEEPTMTHSYVQCYNGSFDWFVDNFRKRRQMEGAGLIGGQESPYFCTDLPGYRVQLKFFLNGAEENRGKGLSVEVNFLKGRWDKELPKFFSHRLTLTLLNRKDPSASVERRVEKNILKNKRRYVVHLCSQQLVENLIENDTLYYRVKFEEQSKK